MTDDVKELLGKAFGPEPPMRIDRDEVFRQGRKRLRRRRFFEAGGVVTAVVVAVVGATTLTNLVGSEPDEMPPAASRTQSAPPGLELPLTQPDLPTTRTTEAPSSSPPVTTTTTTTNPPLSTTHAARLTQLLYESGVVKVGEAVPPPRVPGGPRFRIEGDSYVYEADVFRPSTRGLLSVTVSYSDVPAANCRMIPSSYGPCAVQTKGQVDVAVSALVDSGGERRNVAVAVLPDGSQVVAIASNVTTSDRDTGRGVDTAVPPVLDSDALCRLVAEAGLGVT